MSSTKHHPSAHSFQIKLTLESTNLEQAVHFLADMLDGAGLKNYTITPLSQDDEGQQSPPDDRKNRDSQLTISQQIGAVASQIEALVTSRKLVRVVVNKGRGVQESLPCRFLNFREDDQMLTVYHVDESKVYTFHLNEIEDFLIYE